jgi:hypothetical protein
MLYWLSSIAAQRAIMVFAALLAQYAASPSMPTSPATDDRMTTEPPPFARIGSSTACMPTSTPIALVSNARRKSSGVVFSKGLDSMIPALQTRMLGSPKVARVNSIARHQSS